MSARHNSTDQLINNSELYQELLKRKNVKNILQYGTYSFGELKNINNYDLNVTYHVVQPFEKLFMISQKYYNSPEYGWLICYTNKLKNETEIKVGLGLAIYLPIDKVLGII